MSSDDKREIRENNMSIIKSYSVGNGDMFCISHNSDNFTIGT